MAKSNWIWLLVIAGVFLPGLVGAAPAADPKRSFLGRARLPRGVRNNNPGNLRDSGDAWQGLVPAGERTDNAFYQFVSWIWGVRAMVRTIRNYIRQGYDTPAKIITRYCPPSDCTPGDPAGTTRYIEFVEGKTGIGRHTTLSPDDKTRLQKIVRAMAQMENWNAANADLVAAFGKPENLITDAEFNYAWDQLGA